MVQRKVPRKHLAVLTNFPQNVPKKLIKEYKAIVKTYKKEGGYQRKLAKHLDINFKYLNDLLIHGIEPTVRTDKGQIARRKLFLSNKKSKEELNEIKQKRREVKERFDREIQEYLSLVMKDFTGRK